MRQQPMRERLAELESRVRHLDSERTALAIAYLDRTPYVRLWAGKDTGAELTIDYYRPMSATGGFVIVHDHAIAFAGYHADAIEYLANLAKSSDVVGMYEFATECRAAINDLRFHQAEAMAS